MAHPRDVFDSGKSCETSRKISKNKKMVEFIWGKDEDPFDSITQITEVSVTIRHDRDGWLSEIHDQASQRCLSANEFQALVEASGRFEIVDTLGSLDLRIPFNNDKKSWRMVPILKRL